MKSIVMAVLLIAAVGAGVYFLFLQKKNTIVQGNQIQKEFIVGKWKLDSLSYRGDTGKIFSAIAPMIDSGFSNYAYQFQPDGNVLRLLKDSVQKDTSRYEWNGDQLVFVHENDSSRTKFIVSILSKDSLVLQSKDSTIAYFTKAK